MSKSDRLIKTLSTVTRITNETGLGFEKKISQILAVITDAVKVRKGSIQIKKGYKHLEVIASTDQKLIGMRQPLSQDSPSTWVVKNKKPLYVSKQQDKPLMPDSEREYEKDAFFIAPLFLSNKVIGTISLTDKLDEDCFSKDDQNLLINITGNIISALEADRLSKSLKKSRNELKKKNDKLKALEKIRTDFSNMLVHDLKGPVSEIVANLDILSYTVGEADMEYVNSAQYGCDTMMRMISDLLDIARLEDGTLNLIPEKLEPEELIRDVFARLDAIARIKKVTLKLITPEPYAHCYIIGDRQILMRVFQNLLINAIQFSPSEETVQVGFRCDKNKAVFFVTDKGPGVPAEYRDSIFDKFMQVTKKNDGRKYTTGLGLTFCKLAVEAHKGQIFVQDGENRQGSCFEFHLKRLVSGV